MHDIGIRGGTIVDGTGAPAFQSDVALEIFDALTERDVDAIELAAGLATAAKGRHVLGWAHDDDLQDLFVALGADGKRVRGMLLRQVALMTVVGGLVGLAAAVGIGTAARSQLFEIEGYDPVVMAVSAVLLAIVALTAGFIPALRASRIDPMRALRYE